MHSINGSHTASGNNPKNQFMDLVGRPRWFLEGFVEKWAETIGWVLPSQSHPEAKAALSGSLRRTSCSKTSRRMEINDSKHSVIQVPKISPKLEKDFLVPFR